MSFKENYIEIELSLGYCQIAEDNVNNKLYEQ
jgi:hypothetical protein